MPSSFAVAAVTILTMLAFLWGRACEPYEPPSVPDPEVLSLGKLPGTDCTLFRITHLYPSGGLGNASYVTACPAHVPKARTEVRKQQCAGKDCCLEITTVTE